MRIVHSLGNLLIKDRSPYISEFCTHFNRKSGEEIPAGRRPCGPGFCTKQMDFWLENLERKRVCESSFKIDKLNVFSSWSTQKLFLSLQIYFLCWLGWSYNSPLAPYLQHSCGPDILMVSFSIFCGEFISIHKLYHFCKDHREDNERREQKNTCNAWNSSLLCILRNFEISVANFSFSHVESTEKVLDGFMVTQSHIQMKTSRPWALANTCHLSHLLSLFSHSVWLSNPVDWSKPGFPVLHYLLEFAQTHVH